MFGVLHITRAATSGSVARKGISMEEVVRGFSVDAEDISEFYDLSYSSNRVTRLSAITKEWQNRLQALDFSALDQNGKIDFLLLRNALEARLHQHALEARRLSEIQSLIPFRMAIEGLEESRRLMRHVDAASSADVVAKIPKQVEQLRERLEAGKKAKDSSKAEDKNTNSIPWVQPSALWAKRASRTVDELSHSLRQWFEFYDGFQPEFSWWLKRPQQDAEKALEDYARYLREEIAGVKGKDEDPLLGEALGREELSHHLAAEMLPYSPDDLIAIGEREFAWCESELRRAASEMGFGSDWKAALARVKADFAPPGTQDDSVLQFARESIDYVKNNDLVTVPPLCEETWRLSMISPAQQKSLPFAAYGGQKMLVAYAKDEMKHEDKLMSMRGNNRHFTRIVTAHELIPGHHLQKFIAARERRYRSLFSTPFLVEGWALYWELTLWERGYAKTPEDRIGMLFWRLHRCARIIVSLKFHLDQMKPSEMVDFLVDRVGHERFGATSEVRRFIGGDYSPLYQCGYMIGGLQLRALYRERMQKDKISDRQFNDEVLSFNAIPIEFIRAGMLRVPLTKDQKPSWRFDSQNGDALQK